MRKPRIKKELGEVYDSADWQIIAKNWVEISGVNGRTISRLEKMVAEHSGGLALSSCKWFKVIQYVSRTDGKLVTRIQFKFDDFSAYIDTPAFNGGPGSKVPRTFLLDDPEDLPDELK